VRCVGGPAEAAATDTTGDAATARLLEQWDELDATKLEGSQLEVILCRGALVAASRLALIEQQRAAAAACKQCHSWTGAASIVA